MLIFHTANLKGQLVPYSYRSRAIIPSGYIDDSRTTNDLTTVVDGDIVVLGKKHQLKHAQYLKDRGIKFIIDVADDKFAMFTHWKETIPMANYVTTTCEHLGDRIKELTGVERIDVIPDPTERERLTPHILFRDKIRLFYYGADSNMAKIDWVLLTNSLKKVKDFELILMTNKAKDMPKSSKFRRPHWNWMNYNDINGWQKQGEDIWKETKNWSHESQQEMYQWCDIVILPVSNDKESKSKGNNRPIDAIQSGRFVITNPGVPSYEKISQYMWMGNISEGLQFALNNREEVLNMIQKGQQMIDREYTPYMIAKKWEKAYEYIMRNDI